MCRTINTVSSTQGRQKKMGWQEKKKQGEVNLYIQNDLVLKAGTI